MNISINNINKKSPLHFQIFFFVESPKTGSFNEYSKNWEEAIK